MAQFGDGPTIALRPQVGLTQSSAEPGGQRFGRYVLVERIGQGGMGVVYRAFDPRLKRHIALKLLLPERSSQNARLIREAQAMAMVSDPSVVQVYDTGLEDGKVFIAMELIDGTTLSRWLRSATRTVGEILDAFLAAGHGLATAHAFNVIHRDFKPSNVLVSRRGRVVVSDFGIATPIERSVSSVGSVVEAYDSVENDGALHTITLTQSGQGTPRYMAPEQRDGRTVETRADQYSFCVALTEALRDHSVPDAVMGCLRKGLAHNPAARFSTMDELLAAIRFARQPLAAPPRYRRWGWGAAAAMAIALIAAIGIASDDSAAPSEPIPAANSSAVPVPAKTAVSAAVPPVERLQPRPNDRATVTVPKTKEIAPPTHTTSVASQKASGVAETRRPKARSKKRRAIRPSTRVRDRRASAEQTKEAPAVPDELIRDPWSSR